MQKGSARSVGRLVDRIERAPIAVTQPTFRFVLARSEKGRNSVGYQADLVTWIRLAQRGSCGPVNAREIFGFSAAFWTLLSASGCLVGMFLDYVELVPFEASLIFSLSAFPSFALLSGADCLRATRGRGSEPVTVRNAGGRKVTKKRYVPIGHR
ncbi:MULTISPECIES: hypothetical protein [unclassified Streptomyces]|uniref:hypothetical protein n=1 Tax=unclassified Streptomyces TaxID=2593676 RepID=UPI0016613AE1|nr:MULTISPECIES: hypothetical protein [unclassified Streptomyces]